MRSALEQERSTTDENTRVVVRALSEEPRVEERLQALRAEMQAALEEERANNHERTRALSRALSEEFEKSILSQATACARSEALSMSCSVVIKEFENWQKDCTNVQTE